MNGCEKCGSFGVGLCDCVERASPEVPYDELAAVWDNLCEAKILRQAGKIIKMKKEMAKMKKKMEEFKSVAVSLYELQLIRDEIHRRRLASLHRSPLPNTYLV